MRILFVASLHHPQQLIDAVAATPPGAEPPLFPPSMGQHHWAAALRERGHTLDVFYRNLPGYGAGGVAGVRALHQTEGLTVGKVLRGAANRLPPHLNPDKRQRNANLLKQAHEFQPDVLWLIGDNRVIYPDTLAQIKRELGCTIVYASGTSPIVFSHKIERDAARLYDLVLVNDFYHGMQWRELGAARAVALPLSAVTPDFHRPYDLTDSEREQYTCDIAFVGTLVPSHLYSRRIAVLEALRGHDLGIWSVHEVPPSLRGHWRGRALGAEMLRVTSAAKLTVNIHGDFMHYGGNMRTFEAAGVGVCQIADDLPGTRQWFTNGENITLFDTTDGLQSEVARLLADDAERERLGQNARQHVYDQHTYLQRMTRVERLLDEVRDDDRAKI